MGEYRRRVTGGFAADGAEARLAGLMERYNNLDWIHITDCEEDTVSLEPVIDRATLEALMRCYNG